MPRRCHHLNSAISPALDHVVAICIAKDPEGRWQTAHDVLLQLKWIAEAGSRAGIPAPVVARRKKHNLALWAALAASMGAMMVLGWVPFQGSPATSSAAPTIRYPCACRGRTFVGRRHSCNRAGWSAAGLYGKPPHRRPCVVVPGTRCLDGQAAHRHGKCCAPILVARQPFRGFLFGSGEKAQESGRVRRLCGAFVRS